MYKEPKTTSKKLTDAIRKAIEYDWIKDTK